MGGKGWSARCGSFQKVEYKAPPRQDNNLGGARQRVGYQDLAAETSRLQGPKGATF